MSSPFAISAPATTVRLDENRLGEMPFTVTNMTTAPIRVTASVVALDSAPLSWFSPVKSEISLPARGSAQILIRVEPPLGAAAATERLRVDLDDPTTPDRHVTGPSCAVVVPPSQARTSWKKPRGYLATLAGSSIGGAIGELVIFLAFARGPAGKECGADVNCAFGSVVGAFVFYLVGILLGLLLLWIGAAAGVWTSLRLRRYLGSKLTAFFLAVLMIPWSLAMLWLLGLITDRLVVAMILAPILLTAIPGLIARGSVLLIRTKQL